MTVLAVSAVGLFLGCSSSGAPAGGTDTGSSGGGSSGGGSGSASSSSGGSASGGSSSGGTSSGGSSGGGSGGGASSSGSSSGGGSGSPQGSSSGSDAGSDGTAPPEGGPSGDAGGSQCAAACGGSTPYCDQGTCKACTSTAGCTANAPVCDTVAGQCKQVHVIGFHLLDPQQMDRAHAAYVRHADVWFPQQATTQTFYTYEDSTNWDQLKTITPAPGLVIMFLDAFPEDPGQQMGFQTYMQNGGAWFGCHVSAYNDNSGGYAWRWYFDQFLGGGYFNNNTWFPTPANLHVEDTTHPLSQGLGAMFTSAPSEFYSWQVDLRTLPNIKILLSVDPSSFPLGTDPAQSWTSGYYPIAWTNTKYKMLYVNMGHEQMDYGADMATSSTFDSPTQNIMYMNAFKWLGGAQL